MQKNNSVFSNRKQELDNNYCNVTVMECRHVCVFPFVIYFWWKWNSRACSCNVISLILRPISSNWAIFTLCSQSLNASLSEVHFQYKQTHTDSSSFKFTGLEQLFAIDNGVGKLYGACVTLSMEIMKSWRLGVLPSFHIHIARWRHWHSAAHGWSQRQ